MKESLMTLDNVDQKIIEELQKDCRIPIGQISKKIGIPTSTIQYRIKRLEKVGIIEGYQAQVNFEKMGKDYTTITFVRTKYGKNSYEKVGTILSQIPGVSGVFFVLGEIDFVVLCRSNDREDFMSKLDILLGVEEIERTNTMVVMKTIREGSKIDYSFGNMKNSQRRLKSGRTPK